MATGQLEIERKLDVDAAFVLPELVGVAGIAAADAPVEHQLEAVYHDTPDLRLLRARVTLRRRSGGTDEGWHLKLPAASARRELHAPLGGPAKKPPRVLTDPVVGILRGAPVGPVATLHTHRSVVCLRDADGRLLAEVADDTVTAAAFAGEAGEGVGVQTWREVEVELVDGDEELLAAVGERLVTAGARPATTASKLGRTLASRLPAGEDAARGAWRAGRKSGPSAGEVVLAGIRSHVADLQAADLLLRTDQPDAVHQLRVAGRRLRSDFAAFRSVLDRAVTEPLREELAWLGGQLSAARDDEVALAHLRALAAAEPDELVLGPVAARLQQTELRAVAAGVERALDTLSGPRYLSLLDALHDLLDSPPFTRAAGRPAGPVMRDALRRTGRRLRRRLTAAQRASGSAREAALHDVRRAARRVRFTAEVAGGGGRALRKRKLGKLRKGAKRAQTVLGELQDSVITREHSRRIAIAATAAGESAFPYGRLHALEEARAARAVAAFDELEPRLHPLLKAAAKKG